LIAACFLASATLLVLPGCGEAPPPPVAVQPGADAQGHTAPTTATTAALAQQTAGLPLDDPQDHEDATRGFIATDKPLEIPRKGGGLVWNRPAYDFIQGPAPASANPSLWRQEQLNNLNGLFEVAPGIHQVRGYDLANMTLIDGKTGWILVDPLGSTETARAALALARRELGDHPIQAVIFTHSHVDHFGGILGVVTREDIESGRIPLVAPKGFLHEATSENVLAGPAMARRAAYMYGFRLARSPRGHIGSGLGKEPGLGQLTILPPTRNVDHTPQEMQLDGVRFIFMYVPESEAPTELMFFLPKQGALCAAELATHNLHNLYTLRGAKVRDALRWSGYLDDALTRFGADTQVVFASHHWPTFGHERTVAYLKRQRDVYKYIHDQTLRLANAGETPREIAEQLTLPASLAKHFGNRGYYGTVSHNAKAVYQWYFGWYDSNPAHLDPLPPVAAARHYVEAMGGGDAVLQKAQAAFDRGEYRWVAMLLNHLVFAEPQRADARGLLAQAYDQLGYQAESGPWRDEYLTGAYELRHSPPPAGGPTVLAGRESLLAEIPVARFLDAMAARLNGPKAEGRHFVMNLVFTDLGETHVVELENSVLHHREEAARSDADVTLRMTHGFFLRMLLGQTKLREMVFSDDLAVEGSRTALLRFFLLLDPAAENFPIVTP